MYLVNCSARPPGDIALVSYGRRTGPGGLYLRGPEGDNGQSFIRILFFYHQGWFSVLGWNLKRRVVSYKHGKRGSKNDVLMDNVLFRVWKTWNLK